MQKKVLVVGGTYFAGRVFSIIAAREADFALTLINRGRFSMKTLPNLQEFVCDRKDPEALRALPEGEYDAVVDFCAYCDYDVRTLLTNLPGKFGRYILVSTADVCVPVPGGVRDENSPMFTAVPDGPAGDYIYGKVKAENEARRICAERGIPLTIMRPSFIYGPYNYAPRESYYIRRILEGKPLTIPSDGTGKFQFVYVKDVTKAIIACVNSETPGAVYTLAAPEVMTYEKFIDVLRTVSDRPFETQSVTVQEVVDHNLPLPFPLTEEENEVFDGSLVTRVLGLQYTDIAEGMKKAFAALK